MKWVSLDELHNWLPTRKPRNAEEEQYMKGSGHYKQVPDKLHARLLRACKEIAEVGEEIDKL